MDISRKIAESLARRSSRRQFFKLLGAGSLGAGLFLTGTDVSLGAITGCVGCGGGPCNPCGSPARVASSSNPPLPVQDLPVGGGCPDGCTTGGEWFCCLTSGDRAQDAVSAARSARARRTARAVPATASRDLPMPCTPRQHSGDQPCTCPPPPPIPSLALDG